MIFDSFKRVSKVIRRCLLLVTCPKHDLAQRYPQYQIGHGTYSDLSVYKWGEAITLTIGAYTSIASGVKVFLGGEHRTDWVATYPK